MAVARARQVKTLERVVLGIRACSIEKLSQLNNEFVEHQEWLRQTLVDTREQKDALGLVCPRTTRKAKKATSVVAKAAEASARSDDVENMENGATAKPARKGRGKVTKAPLQEVVADDDISVFDLEEASENEGEREAKKAKISKKGGRQVRAKADIKEQESKSEQEQEQEQESKVKLVKEEATPAVVDHKAELNKMKVTELRSELQSRSLPMGGAKADLIERLNVAMICEKFRANKAKPKLLLGRDVRPVLGMRVVHTLGEEHGSSRGLYGTVEYIPGRGGNPNEKSVSVRWVADLSDVRGPYYTGEQCDRGSGIGDAKFDLICLDDCEADIFPEREVSGLQMDEREEAEPEVEKQEQREEVIHLQEPAEDKPEKDTEVVTIEETPKRGTKRASDGSPKEEQLAGKPEQQSPKAPSPSPPAQEDESSSAPLPTTTPLLMQKLGAVRQAWADRETLPLQEKLNNDAPAPQATPTPADSQKQPVMSSSSSSSLKPTPSAFTSTPDMTGSDSSTAPVSESVQAFRAIISRIHSGHTPNVDPAGTPGYESSSEARHNAPRVLSTHKPATDGVVSLSSSTAKSGTWPIPAVPQATKPADPFANANDKNQKRSSAASSVLFSPLTSQALSAHVQSTGGKLDPLQNLNVKSQASVPKVLDVRVSQSTAQGTAQQRMDFASRQQRAAENRARLDEDKKKILNDQEKKKKELDAKRLEAEKIANERRQKEAQIQAEKAESARLRAQQEEERKIRAVMEEERRKEEREEELEKIRAQQAAKPAVPTFSNFKSSPAVSANGQPTSASKGIFGAIGGALTKVFGGQEYNAGGIKKTESTGSNDSGPTSIQIQMEKNSDDSDDEEEEGKKQPPAWARSPNLRNQINRQEDMSPTPIFGECKKTCDLGHIFQNHQPKRRKYDKRTSSADWGDDGRASYMQEERFQRQMIQNMAMQQAGKPKW